MILELKIPKIDVEKQLPQRSGLWFQDEVVRRSRAAGMTYINDFTVHDSCTSQCFSVMVVGERGKKLSHSMMIAKRLMRLCKD
jgi:hypothetical protein